MRVSLHCQGCAGKVKKHLSKMEGRYLLLGVGYNANMLHSIVCNVTTFKFRNLHHLFFFNLVTNPNISEFEPWTQFNLATGHFFFYLSITTSNPPNFTQSQPHFQLLYYLTSKYKWLNLNFVKEGLCRCWILFQRCSGYS